MNKYYRVHEVAELLKVSTSAVRDYVRRGLLECDRTPSNQRVFSQEQVDAFLGVQQNNDERLIVAYVRSSRGLNTELESQKRALTEAYGVPQVVYSDKGSGLNEKRKGLNKLLDDVEQGKVKTVLITQKDRLTRFGYDYLVRHLEGYNVQIVVFGEKETTLQEELLQDFMSLIASFSGKFYRLRGYEQQKQLLNTLQENLNEKTQ